MKESNNIKNYSAEDIQRYWRNEMSPAEMHALEKAAMDDPFLADALEGYSEVSNVTGDVAELKRRLNERTGKTISIRRNYYWLRVAAAIILFLGIGTLTYKMFESNQPAPDLTKRETASQKDSKQQDASSNGIATNTDTNNDHKAQIPPALGITTQESSSKDQGRQAKSNFKQIEEKEKITSPSKAGLDSGKLSVPDRTYYDQEARKLESGKEPQIPSAMNKPASNDKNEGEAAGNNRSDGLQQVVTFNNYSGRVIDPQRNAIANASVRLNNANQVTTSDQNGYFNFRSMDTTASVSITFLGYRQTNLDLQRNQAPPEIMLTPDSKSKGLKEVVVSSDGLSKKSKAPSDLKIYVMDAQPTAGWNEFNEYIEKNKKFPPGGPPKTGEVVVTFRVDQKGGLSSFFIEKSLDSWYDAEAIRLIKEGPPWKVTKGRKPRVKVIIKF